MRTIFKNLSHTAILAGLILTSSAAMSSGSVSYQVTITNITNSINFTPILVASHRRNINLFELGSAASADLTDIAESGNTDGLEATLGSNPHVIDVKSTGALLTPGESVSVMLDASHGAKRISMASMMLPTNDGFIALDSVKVPKKVSATYFSVGYDAGTEPNDEWCMNIPGPTCEGVGPSLGIDPGDEGYVHVHRGIHGIGNLVAADKDWRNPVAKITVKRIRNH